MRSDNILFALILVLALVFILSFTGLMRASIDIHLHDTYFVIDSSTIVAFGLMITLMDFLLYRFFNKPAGGINSLITLLQIGFLLIFFIMLFFAFTRQFMEYAKSSLVICLFLSLVISQLLMVVYIVLPRERIP